MELKLSQEEVYEIVNLLYGFYDKNETLYDYYLTRKKEKIRNLKVDTLKDNLFNDYTIQPKDMDIEVELMDGNKFQSIVQIVVSIPLENQWGRQLMLGVKEKTTNKYLGFIRICSPIMSIKPRNEYFNQNLTSKQVNGYFMNGGILVPSQPFGFNCLGGKLLTYISLSNEVREMIENKYDNKLKVVYTEITSLYGNIKTNSQYDGMEPYLKYYGQTDSEVFIYPTDDIFQRMKNIIRPKYGKKEWDGNIIDGRKSGPKQKEFSLMIRIIKNHLSLWNKNDYIIFNEYTKKMKSKTKKRYYMSDMGYKNSKEYVLSNGEVELIDDKRDKYNLDYLIELWKVKSQKRWEKLNSENRLRTELEIYDMNTIENKTIDIIR